MYQLLIVDDEPLVQAGIRSMLNWNEMNIEICGTAMNGQAALKIIEEKSPDIVITDIKMPVMNGLELAKGCRERYAENCPYFIILTSYEDFQMARDALAYQVSDYLVKLELTPEVLKTAIDRVLSQISQSRKKQLSAVNIHPFYDKFLISLLHDLFESEEQFRLQSRDLNLNFDYGAYICCYGEILSPQADQLSAEQQLSLFSTSLQMIRELGGKYLPLYALSLDLRHFALIFCFTDPADTEDYAESLTDILQSISGTLQNYYNVTLRCGIGLPVQTPGTICDSYQYARQIFQSTEDNASIVAFDADDSRENAKNSFNISLFKNDLTRAFEEYDPDILKNTIQSLCDLFRDHPGHYVQALDAASNILYLSISLLQDGESTVSGFFAEDPDGYRSLYKQSNVDHVIQWLQLFSDKLCELFQTRRKDYKNHIVTNVRKYINEHVSERLSLNEVAAVFGISPNYLSQLFSKYNDTGFSEYINICKVTEAKRLLEEENMKVYEVAEALGFESAFYFSKVFKRVDGVSPTDYVNSKFS